jgi:hypothetical protein
MKNDLLHIVNQWVDEKFINATNMWEEQHYDALLKYLMCCEFQVVATDRLDVLTEELAHIEHCIALMSKVRNQYERTLKMLHDHPAD